MIPRSLALRALRIASTPTHPIRSIATITITSRSRQQPKPPPYTRSASHTPPHALRFISSSNKSPADEKIEEITELFYTAQDEFEIAMEETEKVSVYAEEDRKAAKEELTKVQEAYRSVVEGADEALAEEVKSRIGQRVRELEQGVAAMEEMAMHQD